MIMSAFLANLKIASNYTNTENGAKTNSSSLSGLIDFFGLGASLRDRSSNDIIQLFSKAFHEDPLKALKILFYFRDIRHGQGERRMFKIILAWLSDEYPSIVKKNLSLIKEFGRWDDILCLQDTKVWPDVLALIKAEFFVYKTGAKPSLLFKWLPSINASSQKSRQKAKLILNYLNISEKSYRKTLSKARKELQIVERHMCLNQWSEINYQHVPSKASLKYKEAFKRHDKNRYSKFIEDVKAGKSKINASITYPYEIVEKALFYSDNSETLDAIWDSLPNYIKDNPHNGIVVADVSNSMMTGTPKGRPLAISISLALYLAERMKGPFSNHFITFSEKPVLQKIAGKNIREKIRNLAKADWGMSTNLEAVFDLILDTAIKNHATNDDMPQTIYIVSDMEFDISTQNTTTNYELIKSKYNQHGYHKPAIVFWNANARNTQFPITQLDDTTCLVSGCSPIILENLLSGKRISPEQIMLETINKDRYNSICI